MTQILITKLNDSGNAYISLIKNNNKVFITFLLRINIFFTKFFSFSWRTQRYVLSRYYLMKSAKKFGLFNNFKYCFSHSRKYSAVIFSSCKENFSIDIEPVNRKLSLSLKTKISNLYPNLLCSELNILMIIETLVKLSIYNYSFKLSDGLSIKKSAKIKFLNHNIFQVAYNNIRVYSKIYKYDDLYICVTRQKNQFPTNL